MIQTTEERVIDWMESKCENALHLDTSGKPIYDLNGKCLSCLSEAFLRAQQDAREQALYDAAALVEGDACADISCSCYTCGMLVRMAQDIRALPEQKFTEINIEDLDMV